MSEPDFPIVSRTIVEPDVLRSFEDEDDFIALGVSLLAESASYIVICAGISEDGRGLSRNQAIISGLMVRLYKLVSGVLDQVCQRRLEIAFILCRLCYEAVVDVRYLIANVTDELADDYVKTSFRYERMLRDEIVSRSSSRGGELLPVEQRMLKSIQHSAIEAGINLDDVSTKMRKWGGKSTKDKAQTVYGNDLSYIGMFSGMSKAVHGNWGDLAQFHLTALSDGRFAPNTEWGYPRPQVLTSLCVLALGAVRDCFQFWSPELMAHYDAAIEDLDARVRTLAAAHEDYLCQFAWPRIRPGTGPVR